MAKTLVGLDVGHQTVRALALRRVKNVYTVAGWAAVPRYDDNGEEIPLTEVLKSLAKRVDLGNDPVVSISTIASLVRYVSTVALPPDRLAKSLRLELQQSMEGTELAADTFTLPLATDELRHCCVLTQPTQVREALVAFTQAKVPVGTLHFAPAALLNSTLVAPPIEGDKMALVVDIGAQTTSVGLVSEGRLLACRQLSSGGQNFTDTLANARGLTTPVAETWKIHGQLPGTQGNTGSGSGTGRAQTPASANTAAAITHQAQSQIKADDSDNLFDDDDVTPAPSATSSPAHTASAPVLLDDSNSLFLDDGPSLSSLPAVSSTPAPDIHISTESVPNDAALLPNDDQEGELIIIMDDSPDTAADDMASLFASPDISSAPGFIETSPEPVFDPFAPSPRLPAPGRATIEMALHELGPEMIKAAEMLYSQLSSSIAWFKTQLNLTELPIATVILSGGGAGLNALDTYLSRRFDVPVRRSDPFLGIQGTLPDRPHEYATALGLALSAQGGHADAIHLNLLPEGLLLQRLWRTTLVWPYVAAAAVLLAGILTAWTWTSENSANEIALDDIQKFISDKANKCTLIENKQLERGQLEEDLRAIASRIYAARDLLYTIRALKEQTANSPELWVTRLETVDVSKDIADKDVGKTNKNTPTARTPTKTRSVEDTTIGRGGVKISGFVKFDAAKTDPEMNSFFDTWRQAILNWQPAADQQRLMSGRHVEAFNITHTSTNTKSKTIKEDDGKVPFTVLYKYQPTDLGQVTIKEPLTAPTAKTPEVSP